MPPQLLCQTWWDLLPWPSAPPWPHLAKLTGQAHSSLALYYDLRVSRCAHSMQEMPLEGLALKARCTCISGPHRTEIIEELVLRRLPQPGHCTDIRLKHTSKLPVTSFSKLEEVYALRNTWKQTQRVKQNKENSWKNKTKLQETFLMKWR